MNTNDYQILRETLDINDNDIYFKTFGYYYSNIFNKFGIELPLYKYETIRLNELFYIMNNYIIDEYLNINCFGCENCYCCISCENCKDCNFLMNCFNCEKCEDCVYCEDCEKCNSCKDCKNCQYLSTCQCATNVCALKIVKLFGIKEIEVYLEKLESNEITTEEFDELMKPINELYEKQKESYKNDNWVFLGVE